MSASDPGEQITRMLTDLANDPAAPPSSVDALSVIRAAKAAAVESQGEPAGVDEAAQSPTSRPDQGDPVPTEVLRFRPRRRRTALIALLAAASVAAVAALVIPLSMTGGSSTSSSADAERAVAESANGASAPDQPAAAAAAPATGFGSAADAAGSADAADSAGDGSVPAAKNAPADGSAVTPSCWPAVSGQVVAALGAVLPPGAFGPPQPLAGSCPTAPVAGALLPGAIAPSAATGDATGTAAADSSGTAATGLVVRISRADPGACTAADPATGERCGSREDGTYLAADGPAGPTAYAYGNGDEVAIGGSADTGAVPGLTAEQLAAAARAVLGALG